MSGVQVYINGDPISMLELFSPSLGSPIEVENWQVNRGVRGCAGEVTLNVKAINKLALYSLLYGRKVTNNWLKMHGGVMIRRGGKRKR